MYEYTVQYLCMYTVYIYMHVLYGMYVLQYMMNSGNSHDSPPSEAVCCEGCYSAEPEKQRRHCMCLRVKGKVEKMKKTIYCMEYAHTNIHS